jgi:cytochrome c oxidase subunit 1
MTMFRMPLTAWGIYAGAVIQVAVAPVMGMTFILLLLEHIMGVGVFDPAKGGDAVLYQHFFWFFAHPSLFMALLPGFGIVSDIISSFSGKKPFGYAWLVVSFLAVALLSFMSWGNHIPASAQSAEASAVFAFFAWMTAVPVILCMVHWTATMYKGAVRLHTPMVYALIFMFLFSAGGLMGGMLALPSLNAYLRDTYFTVAHLHYLVLGGTVMAFFAGVHYWWPKITGKMYNELWARLTALVVLIGFNMAFLPQLVLGVQGVPRRLYGQLPEFTLYHQLSTLGGLILGAGLLAVLANLLVSLRKGEGASENPWGSKGLEWTAAGSHLRRRTSLPHDLKLREKRMSQKRRRFNGR